MLSGEFPSQVPVYVLVGDSSRIYSHLLAEALKRDPRLRIAGSASSSHEFLEMAARTIPDVVVISANLDDNPAGGMAALREFYETHPQTPSVMLLDSPKRELVLEAFRSGACGIFSKHESPETLCKCVRVVFEGQVWASSQEVKFALGALLSAPTPRAGSAGGLSLLSRREQQVVHCLAEGLTNREIGARLGLSRHTVKNYLLKIFDKLGVSNRVELLFLTLSQPASATLVGKEIEE